MVILYASAELPATEQLVVFFVFGLITFLLWSVRDTRFGFLWKIYKLFWIILFATLLVNYAKGKIKEWWKE
jgi:hypothetical protein